MERTERITADMLVWAYSRGLFPMADSRDGEARWFSADPRAILPLEQFNPSRSLRKRIRRGDYDVRTDTAFENVIRACAEPRAQDRDTWINDQIIEAFTDMHQRGLAHSVEAWMPAGGEREDGGRAHGSALFTPPFERDGWRLVGGLYGIALGGAFFGESMFSRANDASKVCLAALVERMRRRGFVLLDVQINSEHMAQFGTIDIAREEYLRQLEAAIAMDVSW